MVEPSLEPPIFVFDRVGPDATAFDTVKAAEGFLEPIDAQNNEYELYDATGRRLFALVEGKRTLIRTSNDIAKGEFADRIESFCNSIGVTIAARRTEWDDFIIEAAALMRL